MPKLRAAFTLGVPSFSLGLRRWFYVCWWGQMPIKPRRSPHWCACASVPPVPVQCPCVCVSCVHITAAPELPLLSTGTTLAHKNHLFWPWKKTNVCVSYTHPHCRGKCLFWQIRCCWEGNAPCEWDPVCTSLCVHHDLLWCLFQTGKRVPASIS